MSPRKGLPTPLADLAGALMDPILRRRAGMTTGLLAAWPEIAGPRLAEATRPEKLVWPPRRDETDPFEPASLVVACEAASALRLQHQTSELLARVNAFFGFPAVARIRIVQKPVSREHRDRRPKLRELRREDTARIDAMVANIEDEKLREALRAYAAATLRRSGG